MNQAGRESQGAASCGPRTPKDEAARDSFLLWAKIGRRADDTYARRHPLVCHLVDVGTVASLLWGRVLRDAVKERVAAALGLDGWAENAGRWLAFWSAAHDVGKASPGFQLHPSLGDQRRAEIRAALGARFAFEAAQSHPHQYVSTTVLAACLPETGMGWTAHPKELARRVGIAVGGHHGVFPGAPQWNDQVGASVLGFDPRWGRARRTLLAQLARCFGTSDAPAPVAPSAPDAHWPLMVLAGLVSVADWIGSNAEYFPHAPDADDLTAYAAAAAERGRRALDRLGWLGWKAKSSAPKPFVELFPRCRPPRPLQDEAVAVADAAGTAGLVLIEAPMGEGKTEAALYLCDRWTHGHHGQGLYVAMPTMATGNQMFGRVRDFLQHRYAHDVVNLQLLHGGAVLSDQLAELRDAAEARRRTVAEAARQGFRPSDIHSQTDTGGPGAVVAEAWFAQNRKQALLAPFGVGTIDQALLSVLQVKHGFVRLFALAGKAVVLDEVHAYDAYMSALLERLLEWLAALGCSVVLLSATLPAERRRSLLKAWAGADPPPDSTPYPRMTSAFGGRVEARTFATDPARSKAVALRWAEAATLAGELAAALAGGGCAAVIRNTVGGAQETYLTLKEALRPLCIEVRLFHARFPFEDRQRIEGEVLGLFGKGPGGRAGNPRRPGRAVLVATQVIEQSLDLDFDLMVSDLAPVDLVLQRAGRLHRHDRPRPPALGNPTLWLLKPGDVEAVPVFERGHEKVYDRHILLRSVLALRGRPAVRLPGDIDELVEAVYGGDGQAQAPDEAWRVALRESREVLLADQKEQRLTARTFCVSRPRSGERFVENARRLDDENPELPPEQRAATRLIEPNVQLVLLPRASGWATRNTPPTLEEARGLLARSVSLQHRGAVMHFIREPVPPAWQESGLLRFHRLVELSDEGIWKGGGLSLELSDELGVIVSRGR